MRKILAWCMFLFIETFAQVNVGDICGPKNEGKCISVYTCPTSMEKPASHNLDRCGFQGFTELVCCIDQVIETGMRKSQAACVEYGKETELDVNPFILKGYNASLGEFPHMASLGIHQYSETADSNKIVWGHCTGVLISENYILTAAHCMIRHDGRMPVMVRLGKIDLFGNDDGVEPQDIAVANIILHPEYNHLKKLNDIALVKLVNPARFSKYVYPICLYGEPDTPARLIATGWSATHTSDDIHDFLLQFPVSSIDLDKCKDIYQNRPSRTGVHASQLCAVVNEPLPNDACHLTSGAPIQVENLQRTFGTRYSIVGLISFGRRCEDTIIPSVYTRVYSYLEWIENIVWP